MPRRPQVLTVTLNPALDLTAGVAGFRPGAGNRGRWDQTDPGGKGINAAAFLAGHGTAVTAAGLLGRENDQPFRTLFESAGIAAAFVGVPGRNRTNIKLVDEAAGPGGVTDINFPGFTADAALLDRFVDLLVQMAPSHAWAALSGSLPGGLADDTYGRLTGVLRAHGCRVLLDASGPAFARCIEQAAPDAAKPNIHELSELLGRPLVLVEDALAGGRELQGRGVATVVVSMGAEGAVFLDGPAAVLARPGPVEVRSTVGAGDAMVAGLLAATLQGLPLEDVARTATAWSMGAVTPLGPRLPGAAVLQANAAAVVVEPLEP